MTMFVWLTISGLPPINRTIIEGGRERGREETATEEDFLFVGGLVFAMSDRNDEMSGWWWWWCNTKSAFDFGWTVDFVCFDWEWMFICHVMMFMKWWLFICQPDWYDAIGFFPLWWGFGAQSSYTIDFLVVCFQKKPALSIECIVLCICVSQSAESKSERERETKMCCYVFHRCFVSSWF